MANSELENLLTQAIFAFQLREMLTKFGIPENDEVILEIQAGENPEPLASVKVPTTVNKAHIQSGSLSLESFKQTVKDKFLNSAINILDLGKYISDDEVRLVFSSSSDLNITILAGCCCRINGQCCCYC